MSQPKHTPGPWFPALLYGHMTGVRAGNPEAGRWIAHAWCQTSTPASTEAHAKQVAENEANARLIAAAPELLEALIYLRDCLEAGREPGMGVANRAIAKATGEQPC